MLPFRFVFRFDFGEHSVGTELWPGFPHAGLPNRWNFDFVRTRDSRGGVMRTESWMRRVANLVTTSKALVVTY